MHYAGVLLSYNVADWLRIAGRVASGGATSFQAEKLKLNARAEYAKGTLGTWYGGAAEAPTDTTPTNDNVLGALTLTADYSLWANVVTRAEVRWDKNLGGDDIYHNTGGAQNDADSDALTVTANFVYKF